jgi:hypothetical protein
VTSSSAPATPIAIRGPVTVASSPPSAVMTAIEVLVLTDQADRMRATRSGGLCSSR